MAEFLRVDQTTGTIMLEHQLVLVHHVLAHHRLRRREMVADHLEHQRIVGQREHRHDHALLARRMDKLLRAGLEVAEEVPVALGLCLLEAPEHRVPLVHGLARQQRLQKHDGVADGFEVSQEIRTGDAEQHGNIVAFGKHRVDGEATPVRCVVQRDHDRCKAVGAEYASDQIGTALAIEHRFQHLDGTDWPFAPMREASDQVIGDGLRIAATIRVRHRERVVGEQAIKTGRKQFTDGVTLACDGMGDAVGRFDAQCDELDVGIDTAGLEEAPGQGVVVGLVQLAIEQAADRLFERGLDANPQRAFFRMHAEHAGQRITGFGDTTVIGLDALDQITLHQCPLAPLEAAACALRHRTEAPVVFVKTGAQLLRGKQGEIVEHAGTLCGQALIAQLRSERNRGATTSPSAPNSVWPRARRESVHPDRHGAGG